MHSIHHSNEMLLLQTIVAQRMLVTMGKSLLRSYPSMLQRMLKIQEHHVMLQCQKSLEDTLKQVVGVEMCQFGELSTLKEVGLPYHLVKHSPCEIQLLSLNEKLQETVLQSQNICRNKRRFMRQ